VRDAIVTHELADVAGPPYDLVIHIGDVVYAFGHEKIWRDWFDAIEPISSRLPYMVGLGLGRIVALRYLPPNFYHTHEHIRCLCF
jgi:hypothetical protein